MRLIPANPAQPVELSESSASDQVLKGCNLAHEKLELGDYDAACAALQPWWTIGEWPKQEGLSPLATAELLLTAGALSGWVASTKRVEGGQNYAERLLSGAIVMFDHLGERARSGEGRSELGYCYYRQGLFDLARNELRSSLNDLTDREIELKGIVLIRLATLERHTSRLHDAVQLLNEVDRLANYLSPWTKGRFHLEFATTLKNLGIAENQNQFFDRALDHYRSAFSHFQQIGNHRFRAIVENNHGYLLSVLRRFDEAQLHLERARKLFEELGDQVRRAQVDETLAQLYLASDDLDLAQRSINRAVETMETTGEEEALLAEALRTQGSVLCKLGRRHEAKPILHRARRVAERCGDYDGAGRALLIVIEEMCDQLGEDERQEIGAQANQLLANSQDASTGGRLQNCLERIAAAHAEYEELRERATHAEKMAALGELSFGVAHNVNNTLTGILGRAQLLLRTKDAEKVSSGIEMIIKSAEDGAHIIRRIQDFARRQPSRKFEAVSVAGLMKDVCEMSRHRWESLNGPHIRLALVADCTASVMGDAVELREVLVNMIYNAIDAMPSGGEIRMSSQEINGRVVLTIGDNGTGMAPEVKSRLFDPFFTTKGKGGTGMGMAVSFGIIRRHNGSIDVESEVGRGTTFRILLPIAEILQTQAEVDFSQVEALSVGDRIRALVVDDETAVREVLREALEAEGCEVFVAESGEVALRLFDSKAGQVDVVFTDIGMPEMSGWELASEIRKRSDTLPLAIVSGWADAISCDARQAIKADWVVSKPFDIATIAGIANEVAGRKKTKPPSGPGLVNNNVRSLLGMT